MRTRTALSIFVAPLPHHGQTFTPQRTKIEVAAPPLGIFSLPLQQRTEVVYPHTSSTNNYHLQHNLTGMRIDIISVVPEMLDGFLNTSILARAQKKGLVEIHVHNLRDYTTDKHRRVDDYPYGGFAGMVMQCQPIDDCIAALKAERDYDEVIFTSPDGEKFDQPMANSLSMKGNLIILCGHYKGIDYRIREHLITKEVSIGDFVLTGGELAAACMTDAIVRIIPGAIGDEQSALSDSFQDHLLAAPVYTRPADYKGWKVPDVLLSGHDAKIHEWEMAQSLERTKRLRPDLLEK